MIWKYTLLELFALIFFGNVLHCTYTPVEKDFPGLAGCSTTSNDLVYIIDGSSSLGIADFNTAKRWLVNITSGFDVSSRHTQVAVVQYSDTPRLEIPLGKHQDTQTLLRDIAAISYLGGKTQTGRAIKFATDHVFSVVNHTTKTTRNRIAVVLTDGRSQDDVVDPAMEAKAQNIVLFAVGVGDEITNAELVSMANKPSSTYVLHVEDYTSIGNIRDVMEQKLCEGESSSTGSFQKETTNNWVVSGFKGYWGPTPSNREDELLRMIWKWWHPPQTLFRDVCLDGEDDERLMMNDFYFVSSYVDTYLHEVQQLP